MPDRETVFRWAHGSDPTFADFRGQYARARECQAHTWAEEIIDISDDATNDWMERRSEAEKGAGVNTGWVLNGEHVQRSRLRTDNRKWIVSKMLPKVYGDKLTTELTGANGGPVKLQVVRWAKTPEEATPDPSLSHTTPEASGSDSTKAETDTK